MPPILKRLTAVASSAALALSFLAVTPSAAQAGDDKLFKFIVGATALGIIAHGLSQNQRHHGQVSRHHHPPARTHHAPKHQHRAALLPQSCALSYHDRGARRAGYDGACLRHAGFRNLPGDCAIRSNHGRLYSANCLAQRGYRI
jgi:hypothetical protein